MLTTHPSEAGRGGGAGWLAKLQKYLRAALLLGYDTASSGNFLQTFRENLWVSSSGFKNHTLASFYVVLGKTVFLDRPQEAKSRWEICDALSLYITTEFFEGILLDLSFVMPVPVATRSKMWVCGRRIAGIVGSNPAGDMDVCLL
jgi:hypothetical protein